MRTLFNLLVSSIAVLIAARLLPGVTVDSFATAVVVAVVLGFVNAFLSPVLLRLRLSVNIPLLAALTFAVTGSLVLLTARLIPGFRVSSFWWALAFAFTLSAINILFHVFPRLPRSAP